MLIQILRFKRTSCL